jgi:hypothetical protein
VRLPGVIAAHSGSHFGRERRCRRKSLRSQRLLADFLAAGAVAGRDASFAVVAWSALRLICRSRYFSRVLGARPKLAFFLAILNLLVGSFRSDRRPLAGQFWLNFGPPSASVATGLISRMKAAGIGGGCTDRLSARAEIKAPFFPPAAYNPTARSFRADIAWGRARRGVSSASGRGFYRCGSLASALSRALHVRPYWPRLPSGYLGIRMKTPTAKGAKCGFRRLIDLARAEPVAVAQA